MDNLCPRFEIICLFIDVRKSGTTSARVSPESELNCCRQDLAELLPAATRLLQIAECSHRGAWPDLCCDQIGIRVCRVENRQA